MKLVLISSYFNHHQLPLSGALDNATENNYHYIATKTISEERKAIGYGNEEQPAYVIDYTDENAWDACIKMLDESDVIVAGTCPQSLLETQFGKGKLIFRYSERPLKDGFEPLKYIPRYIKWHKNNPSKENLYMLCASAYTASDYAKFGLFKNRAYKWGYFPETKYYNNVDELMSRKNRKRILWCGRFLELKHPDNVIEVAAMLKKDGCDFSLDFIGMGPMEEKMREMISSYGLDDNVRILGSKRPEEVRSHMEDAGIFLFTSDKREGWGAVMNESMNSACAVVGAQDIGAVPFLIEEGENGMTYHSGNVEELYRCTKKLLCDHELQERMGRAAYRTITEEWNADIAAKRLVCLAEEIMSGNPSPDIYNSGPCSKV